MSPELAEALKRCEIVGEIVREGRHEKPRYKHREGPMYWWDSEYEGSEDEKARKCI
jgi:hypothetical protein